MEEFTKRAVSLILAVPAGKVCSYGGIAAASGSPNSARQVARILHSMSEKMGLPWHRIVGGSGRISLKRGYGFELQRELLLRDGVEVSDDGEIDLEKFGWIPRADAAGG